MTVTLTSTKSMTKINDVTCRIWEGTTEGGIPVVAFIPRISVPQDADQTAFETELTSTPALKPATDNWPLRMVL